MNSLKPSKFKDILLKVDSLPLIKYGVLVGFFSFFFTHAFIFGFAFIFSDMGEMPKQVFSFDLRGFFEDGFFIVIFYPFIETIIGQWIPIKILKKTPLPMIAILIIDALFFAATHFALRKQFTILLVPGAFVFAYTAYQQLNFSNKRAISYTYLTHSIHNLFSFLTAFAARWYMS